MASHHSSEPLAVTPITSPPPSSSPGPQPGEGRRLQSYLGQTAAQRATTTDRLAPSRQVTATMQGPQGPQVRQLTSHYSRFDT